MNIFGINIIQSELAPETTSEPVIELSKDVHVSDEFRDKCDKWYIKMFGYKEVSYSYMVGNNMFMNPKHAAMLIQETRIKD